MTLNANETQNDSPTLTVGGDQPASESRRDRSTISAELLDELSGWNSRDRMGAFKRWHEGSLSLVHLNVLTLLEVEGPLSMSRLAEALDVSVASATGIVDRMERRDFVRRRHDTEDRRVVLVELTDRGAAVFRALGVDRRLRLARVLAELSDDELEGFLKGVRAMHAARERLFAASPNAAAAPSPSDVAPAHPFETNS